jgi:multiple antibiotic resistance protein
MTATGVRLNFSASRRKFLIVLTAVIATLVTRAAFAMAVNPPEPGKAPTGTFSLGKVFIFLFVTLGPFNVLTPFSAMTRGRDGAFKRKLAVRGTAIGAAAAAIAATLGAMVLHSWGVSSESLMLAGGIILFLVALRLILHHYAPSEASEEQRSPAVPPTPWALAVPTIVTPTGLAVLVLLVRLHGRNTTLIGILAVTAGVLTLDLLAMLNADRILKTPFVAPSLYVIGSVMSVLQVALGVEVVVAALRLLGVINAGVGM